jgi:RNA polymerase sigma factor (sigma-70 family)
MNRRAHHPLQREKLEDAGQEVAARIWRDRGLFTGQSQLESWVYPYAFHVWRETVAAQRRVDYRRAEHDSIHALRSGDASAAETLDLQTESGRVRQAMESMDSELVQLIEQHLLLGYSFARIAEADGLALSTVKARYYRGMEALRKKLGTPNPVSEA